MKVKTVDGETMVALVRKFHPDLAAPIAAMQQAIYAACLAVEAYGAILNVEVSLEVMAKDPDEQASILAEGSHWSWN